MPKTSTQSSISSGRPTMSNQNSSSVQEAFQILRAVGQIEKSIQELQRNVQAIVQHGNVIELNEIAKILKHYLKEEDHSVGAKSYENFIKTEMLLSWRYLHVPPTPFLPPIKPQYKYTIVLDLDETIIYYNKQTNILRFRPSLSLFFEKLQSMNFQIILFTASSKNYADSIVRQIQKKTKIFQYRLYKEHLSLYQGKLVKDLRRLGRDLTKTIIIDDMNVNFSSCRQNGIEVTSWEGQREDRQLLTILAILIKLQHGKYITNIFDEDEQFGYTDVRKLIKNCKNKLESMLQIYEVNEFM